MSLFKTRDWWSAPVESEGTEECSSGHLVVCNITNSSPPSSSIIVGGYSGSLKVYSPQTFYNEEEEKELSHYRPDHLVLEIVLGIPILQLASGIFVSGNSSQQLCVLHQDHFVVFSLSLISGQTGHGAQAKLVKSYQHNFHRKAFSMATGNFGSVKGKDFIAVQSLDGCVSFYEQESLGFVCFLPGFLLPGPLAYIPKSDTLITQASDWTLQSYKYQTLSLLDKETTSTQDDRIGGKRIQPEWTQTMSEAALDVKVLVEPGDVFSILLLTIHSFMCYKDSGVLRFVKKLEYNPSCFTAFHHDNSIHICVSSNTHNLLIYKETELKWAAHLPFVPVAVEKADFKDIKGSLVLLGEEGQTMVCYLGTDPSLFVTPPNETREINYEQTDKEMNKLNKIIRNSTKDTGSLVSLSKSEKELFVAASVGNQLESWSGPTRINDVDDVPSVTMVIRLTTHTPIKMVRVNIMVEKPLAVTQNTFVMSSVCDNTQIIVKFYLADPYVPTSLMATIITSYISISGTPFLTKTEVQLPLKLVVKPSAPNKEADNKITISTNKPAVNLPDLFPEFGLDGSVATALGLQFYGGPNITILSSRTTNRYRLQSDSLAALWVIFASMRKRLEKYWSLEGKASGEGLTLSVASPMPTQELFAEIDAHFLRRKKHKDLEAQLAQRTMQFRAVQRRLLTKFKDKTPSPLTNFDNLLDGTHKQILQLIEAINNTEKGLEEDGCQLSCVLRLLVELLCLQMGLEDKQRDLLVATLSPVLYTNMEQGWEEVVDTSVTFVLRSLLGKGGREGGVGFTQGLSMPADTNKLKKHIGLLVDKTLKGVFSTHSDFKAKVQEAKGSECSIPEERNSTENDDSFSADATFTAIDETEVPLGSRLGEDRARSARIRSARIQSARRATVITKLESLEDDAPGTMGSASSQSPERDASPQPSSGGGSPVQEPSPEHTYSEVPEDIGKEIEEEPIYSEIPDKTLPEDEETIPKLNSEQLKKATTQKDALIEAPEDIFGNPIEDEW